MDFNRPGGTHGDPPPALTNSQNGSRGVLGQGGGKQREHWVIKGNTGGRVAVVVEKFVQQRERQARSEQQSVFVHQQLLKCPGHWSSAHCSIHRLSGAENVAPASYI